MFSAVEKNEFAWQLHKDLWEPVNHSKKARKPRQAMAKTVVETGSFYIFRKNLFLEEQSRFCGLVKPKITQNWSNFDIDTLDDLKLCQKIANVLDE
jgi:CMP-N-acetylneuraminic acid synthetase